MSEQSEKKAVVVSRHERLIESDYYRYYITGDMWLRVTSKKLPMSRVARINQTLISVPVGNQAAPVGAVIEVLDPATEDEPDPITAAAPWVDLGFVDMVIDDRFSASTGINPVETSLIPPEEITPGWYRVQVHTRGRQEASQHAALSSPVEHHRIMLKQLPSY